ncbi:hypothetical protein MVES_001690 [Malassezia vespertilionis]|uniref:Hrq1p n=2 Tax=Malassezia vespertilionis TaxID=2020962 RepID=A0A2N1JDG2_9BASI|nr:hypothetical protein MVES_001690 [Malassezia vespertilionis]
MKAICPDLIQFGYVLTSTMHNDVEAHRKRKREKDDLYTPVTDTPPYTLLFSFMDRSMSMGKATGKGVVKLGSKPQTKEMFETIQRRNTAFQRAMETMLAACTRSGNDPESVLFESAQSYMPLEPGQEPQDALRKHQRQRLAALMEAHTRPPVREILAQLPSVPWWRDQIVPGGSKTYAAREPVYASPLLRLPAFLREALAVTHGIREMYTHQALAVSAIAHGKHVIVSTGTSSGKSLVYQVPVVRALADDPASTAMCIFPTKALSQDQLQSLQRLLGMCAGLNDVLVAAYDGDTPHDARRHLRDEARVLFTNPDMLHRSILPHEELWRRLFRGLRIVVLDELHVYTGTFGTHVACILRRLRRLCAALGNHDVQFVSCSATIANPEAHFAKLLALDTATIQVVSEDGSPCGQKEWILWNPPLVDDGSEEKVRVSAYTQVSQLLRYLMLHGLRTIVFAKVRRTCEIILRQVREDLARDGHSEMTERVLGYRSGYAPSDRRRIEREMFSGRILGLVATSALELGVDIGSLDAVIMFGMPYSHASMWQQAGRAGRRQKDSLVVLLGEPFSVDQHYMRNPASVFALAHAPLHVDVANELILAPHLQCAALEVPLRVADDALYFGPRLAQLCAQHLERDTAGFYHYTEGRGAQPAHAISIRGAHQDTYRYVDASTGTVLEEVETERVMFEAYQGAVFMHQGVAYLCKEVHHAMRVAVMLRADVRYHTRPRDYTDVDAEEIWRIRSLRHSDVHAFFGRVAITTCVWGYYKVDRHANILDVVEVDGLPLVRGTRGVWIDVPWSLVVAIAAHGVNASAAIHAAEHAVLSLTPLFVASAAEDVRTECTIAKRELSNGRPSRRKRPSRLIFYDKPGFDGGVCAQVFQHLDALLAVALDVIENCPCVDGCPGCIESLACVHEESVSSKLGAQAVLRGLLNRPVFDENEPRRHDRGHAHRFLTPQDSLTHTLCSAPSVPLRDGEPIEVEEMVERNAGAAQKHLDMSLGTPPEEEV